VGGGVQAISGRGGATSQLSRAENSSTNQTGEQAESSQSLPPAPQFGGRDEKNRAPHGMELTKPMLRFRFIERKKAARDSPDVPV
jgi:hypothetical protein